MLDRTSVPSLARPPTLPPAVAAALDPGSDLTGRLVVVAIDDVHDGGRAGAAPSPPKHGADVPAPAQPAVAHAAAVSQAESFLRPLRRRDFTID